jgi:hypothetical protein
LPSNRSMEAAHAARWAGSTPEQRKAGTAKARRGLVVAEIRRQVEESRRAQGLSPTVAAEQFLDELAREVLGGGRDGA